MTKYRSFVPSTGAFIVVPEENEKSEPFSNRKQVRIFLVWWARVDSNHRSWKAADLQSVPIGHSGTRPDSIFTATADCLYILPSRLDFVNRFLKKISIKVQLFRKTLRLHGFCFLLASPIPLIVCRFSPCVRFTIMTSSNLSHFPGFSQRIQKQKSHDTHRCFNGISQDFSWS